MFSNHQLLGNILKENDNINIDNYKYNFISNSGNGVSDGATILVKTISQNKFDKNIRHHMLCLNAS